MSPGKPLDVREELALAARRLQEIDPSEEVSRDVLLVILGVMSEAVNHYCDASFAKAMEAVDRFAGKIPAGKLESLRKNLNAAVEAFGGQEAEFRRAAYNSLSVMDRIDHSSAGQARSLFEGAVRAERLLLSASLDAEAGDVEGTLRHVEEMRDLLEAGTSIQGHYRMKICLLGEGAVGKTSLVRRFVHGTFGEEYHQTIGTRISHREVTVPAAGGKGIAHVNLSVWDIMGHERLGRLMQSYLLGAQGGLLVYSLVDRKSESALVRWVEALDRTTGRIPLVVLANKSDLQDKPWRETGGPALAKELRAEVLPSSAKTGLNVELGVSTLVRKILKKKGAAE